MSHRDRNNRKSGVSDSNRHNKYHNKWKNNHWGRNFNNSNYRNTDYGSGHSDNRYNNWNPALPNPWDTDWFNNQHPNFANSHYNANTNNFNVTPGLGVNFSRPNRSKNLKEKPEHRTGDRNFAPKSVSEPISYYPVDKNQKKIVKCSKETPSTVTSSGNSQPSTPQPSTSQPSTPQPCTSQPCSSNSIEKATDANPPKQHEHSAEQVTKKLIHQLTSMNKHNLKQMINNPSSKYETALQNHARNRMRAEMRTKLQNMSSNQENQLVNNVLETEESVDMDKIPDNVFDEIGRVLDINLLGQEDNSNKKYSDSDDKDKEQIAYPEDLFLRAEKLLMENSILFLEDRLNDSMLNSDRLEDDRTPVKIKNEIKEEPDDIGDDNFFEIQESGNDNFSLSDLVFEDREGTMRLRNDNFDDDQLNEIADKDGTSSENHQTQNLDEDRGEMVSIPAALIVKEENSEVEQYEQSTNNNVRDISPNSCSQSSSQPSSKSYKSPDKQRPTECSSFTNNHKTSTACDDFNRALLAYVKQERDTEANLTTDNIYPRAATPEPPKKIDLFTKLQNSGAFESTSVKRRADTKLELTDYKRDNLYSRKKKKKHKSRSRSISRLRSRSRSPSRSRNSYKSKKSSRDRSRKSETSQYVLNNSVDTRNKAANLELSNDSSINPIEQNDESSNKIEENIELVQEINLNKTETSNHAIQDVCKDESINLKTMETQPIEEASKCEEEITATESNSDNQTECENNVTDAQSMEPSPSNVSSHFNEQIDNSCDISHEMKDLPAINESDSMMDVGTDDNVKDTVTETFTKTVTEGVTEGVTEAVTLEVTEAVMEAVNERVTDAVTDTLLSTPCPDASPDENSDNNRRPDPQINVSEATDIIGEIIGEDTSIGSADNSVTLNSESQSSIPDDTVEPCPLKSTQSQKNNIIAIRKIVLKPSSSRHQKDSSKHKCEKERHASSSHKAKKSESKKIEQKGNSSQSTSMTKHPHTDQPHRVWRSAGEKKCIESSSKSTLRSIDIFDPSRPVEPLKIVEPPKATEPKSSSPRKERGKSQSQTTKAPVIVPQPRIEAKKSSPPIKKGSTIAIKEKISPAHRHHNSDSNSKPTESTGLSLSDSLKNVTDNNTVLQRMKDIDLKMMELQEKKTCIDDQIHNLHKEKNVIDQTTIQLQNERFLLLSSLLANSSVSQMKISELPQEKYIEQKVVEVSSDDEVAIPDTKRLTSKIKFNNSKRKIDEDIKTEGVDGTKCKKLKINLNSLKSLANNKSNAVDDVQSDLKTKMMNETRRCTVRLMKLSSKKIKSLMAKSELDSDEEEDISSNTRHKDNIDSLHKRLFDGSFSGHRLPIVHLQVIDGFLIAASEDSNLYMHDLQTGRLLGTFTGHTKTVTNFIATENSNLYSVSLDGCLKKLSLKHFDTQLLSINVGEALQVMDYSWDTAFIGSRSGKIYIFDTKADTFADECLCSVGKSIMALKAAKEGPRKILIASSRCHNISVRDAISGLLLRTIEVPEKLTIYSILLDGGQLYCGTNKNLVFRYEFTSGAEISRIKLGTGTICLKSYKNSLILGGCYDGYIYAYDTKNEIQLSRFPGPGKMLLHFDVYKDNIIAAAKDKSLCVLEVPDDIVSHE